MVLKRVETLEDAPPDGMAELKGVQSGLAGPFAEVAMGCGGLPGVFRTGRYMATGFFEGQAVRNKLIVGSRRAVCPLGKREFGP